MTIEKQYYAPIYPLFRAISVFPYIPYIPYIYVKFRFVLLFEPSKDSLDAFGCLTRLSGKVTLILLRLSLTVTSLRHFFILLMIRVKATWGKRHADWNWIIKTCRLLGVMLFSILFYTS